MSSSAWHLTAADGTDLGRLDAEGREMAWTDCRFTPTPAFARVAPLFAAELELLNRGEMEAWESACERMASLGLVLRPANGGSPVREFILHVDGEQAWFRS